MESGIGLEAVLDLTEFAIDSTVAGGTSPTTVTFVRRSSHLENTDEEPIWAEAFGGAVAPAGEAESSTNTETVVRPSDSTMCVTGSCDPGITWPPRIIMRKPGGPCASHVFAALPGVGTC